MGLFDSVMGKCPTCGHEIEFQSKAGFCEMLVYTVDDAPQDVLMDVLNEPHYCQNCGEWSCLFDPSYQPDYRPPRPTPEMRQVRQPNNPHIHETQPFLRWWDEPFTVDDIITPETGD